MDYEKAYKAVLQTATQWIKDGCTDKEKICLECVFPELRESEDERIRKAIIGHLKNDVDFVCNGITKDECLAWLEKQKEQKPHLELKAGKWYICHRAFCARADHLTVKEGERFQCEKDGIVKGFVIKEPEKYFKECGAPAPMEDEQKEQKPAWSEEDERRIDAICELLENTSAIHPNYSRRELIIWLKSLHPSWKPSDQDELMKLKYAGTSTKLD